MLGGSEEVDTIAASQAVVSRASPSRTLPIGFEFLDTQQQQSIAYDMIQLQLRERQMELEARGRDLSQQAARSDYDLTSFFYDDMKRRKLMDVNLEMSLTDSMRNSLQVRNADARALVTVEVSETVQHRFETVASWLAREKTDASFLKTVFTSKMGKLMARLYREKYDAPPESIRKQVNGEIRPVNVFDAESDGAMFATAFGLASECYVEAGLGGESVVGQGGIAGMITGFFRPVSR